MTQYGQNFSFWALTPFKCTRKHILSMELLIGAVLSISKNFIPKGQRSNITTWPNMTEKTVFDPQLPSFMPDSLWKDFTGAFSSISENFRSRG